MGARRAGVPWRLGMALAASFAALPAFAEGPTPMPQPRSMADVMRPRPGDPCSACRMVAYRHAQSGLPAPVQQMRLAIMDACIRCNAKQLEKLALEGRPRFEFSFDGSKKPAPYWQKQEKTGHRTFAKMVATLHLRPAHDGHLFVWPAAYGKDPGDASWEALREIYANRDIVLFQDYGGFTGMRLAIADDGDWIYGMEGD